MRSCIYCGKNLEKGEKCDCAQSVRMRDAKKAQDTKSTTENTYDTTTENSYTTGYTTKERKKRFKWKKPKMPNFRQKVDARGLRGFVARFVNDPINTVSNPGYLNSWQIILLTVLQGIVLSACYFFIAGRLLNMFNTIRVADLFGFGGVRGLYSIQNLLLTILSGTLCITAVMFLIFGVFWCINKFLLKQNVRFWDFSTRLAVAVLPMTLLGLVGIVIGFFSIYALIMLITVGFVISLILTYEALKSEMHFISSSKALYTMALGVFIILVIIFNILRI